MFGDVEGNEAGTFEECCFCFLKDQGIKAPESAASKQTKKKKKTPEDILTIKPRLKTVQGRYSE